MKQKIYIDASVIGGYFDVEFKEPTRRLFNSMEQGEIIFVVSDLLILELIDAPKRVRELLHRYSDNCFENIVFSEEAANLAKKYMIEDVVDKTSIEDCRHIALATINQCNVLASWNFKHIVNLEKINGYNSVNLKSGYHILEIRSPKELVRYGD
ncbi:MAG: PIN domain protein [Bacteroidetes bacterium]|nr:PIN domain protein [Bacteroidota bacterium]